MTQLAKFIDMIGVTLGTIEKGDTNPIISDFCLVCGLHGDCDNLTCEMKHCLGHHMSCTKNECMCDRNRLTECMYTGILNGIEKRFNGRHIVSMSSRCVEWCKKCHQHIDCKTDECIFDHCVCDQK